MFATSKLRLRSSVGIVSENNKVEFFRSNTRTSLVLKMRPKGIIELLRCFNGERTIHDIHKMNPQLDICSLNNFAKILHDNYILIDQDVNYSHEHINVHYRMVNILEDYFHRTSAVVGAINKIRMSSVMIVGVGAVGSYIATYLAKSGVGHFYIVENDVVDESNLHRQNFTENDIGAKKSESIKLSIIKSNENSVVDIIDEKLSRDFFFGRNFKIIDLIINAADEPNVDFTSSIVSEYAMREKIPHIVGGGYNLHLTLIGQTIIPFETACFKCFQTALEEINGEEFKNIKILSRKNRKLGSFSPLSGIAASLAALDSFKILAGAKDFLQQTNRRVEFDVKQRKLNIIEIKRNEECSWCGKVAALSGR